MITYCRMEAKLIHGQTTTILKTFYKCDGIIVVDELLAADPAMKKVFAAAAPTPIKTYFFGLDKGIQQMGKAEKSDLNYFVIFRNPIVVADIIRKGYTFKLPITCGQQFVRDNTVNVMQGIGLTEGEIEALEFIHSTGAQLLFDPNCKNENIPWSKFSSMIEVARQR